jgi:hypothetical protein
MTRPEVTPKTFTFQQQGLLPQEEKLEVAKRMYQLTIGIPKKLIFMKVAYLSLLRPLKAW